MSEQFICISCWKEFAAPVEELANRGGKVVCPSCGYIQPAPSAPPPGDVHDRSVGKLESQDAPSRQVAQEIPWTAVSAEEDEITVGEDEEHTDRVEVPPDFLGASAKAAQGYGFEENGAAEKTPAEGVDEGDLAARFLKETTDEGVLVARGSAKAPPPPPPQVANWQLRTPTGLTFKFTDPDSLLGWKKKIEAYKRLDVSCDGELWVDFARFVREYEETGDAVKALHLSQHLTDAELPPPRPLIDEDGPERLSPQKSAPGKGLETRERAAANGPQFTFKVKQEDSAGWGRSLLLAVVGIGLGAAIVMAVLYVTGVWTP